MILVVDQYQSVRGGVERDLVVEYYCGADEEYLYPDWWRKAFHALFKYLYGSVCYGLSIKKCI